VVHKKINSKTKITLPNINARYLLVYNILKNNPDFFLTISLVLGA